MQYNTLLDGPNHTYRLVNASPWADDVRYAAEVVCKDIKGLVQIRPFRDVGLIEDDFGFALWPLDRLYPGHGISVKRYIHDEDVAAFIVQCFGECQVDT